MIRTRTFTRLPMLAGALALAGCGGIIPAGKAPSSVSNTSDARDVRASLPAINRGPVTPAPTNRIAATPQRVATQAEDQNCISELSATGAQFNPIPDTYAAPGCNKLGTVQLSALSGDGGRFGLSNVGPLKCKTASTFSNWVRFGVDRAAQQILGSPLERVETMGTYACRNVAGSEKRSAHARAEAIDVSAFVLKDGRRIVLEQDWDGGTAAEREFLRVVHKSACKRFGTVLGPAYNAAHKDHFHLEGTGAKFCR
ncbi:MAG: extensin family protein [Erythrobacter sp.]